MLDSIRFSIFTPQHSYLREAKTLASDADLSRAMAPAKHAGQARH
jgi:hypothetical protein